MGWIIAAILALILLAIWVPTIRRRMLIENALIFGREFYGIDLSAAIIPERPAIVKMIAFQNPKIPQEAFFSIVTPFLNQIGGLKRIELFDGIVMMKMRNAVSVKIYDAFMVEYELLMQLELSHTEPSSPSPS